MAETNQQPRKICQLQNRDRFEGQIIIATGDRASLIPQQGRMSQLWWVLVYDWEPNHGGEMKWPPYFTIPLA